MKRCFPKEEKEVYGFFRKIMATGYCKIEIFENRMINDRDVCTMGRGLYCYHEEWTHLRDSDRVKMEVKVHERKKMVS